MVGWLGGWRGGVWVLALAAVILSLGVRLAHLNLPLADYHSKGEAVEAITYNAARNYWRYGFAATRGLEVLNAQEAAPENWNYYPNHPATTALLAGASFMAAGGPGIGAARVLPFLAFLVQLWLLYRIARRQLGSTRAAVATAIYSWLPMTLLFAHQANYEAYCLVSMLLFADRMAVGRRGQAAAALFGGCLVDFVAAFPAVAWSVGVLVRRWGDRAWPLRRALGAATLLGGATVAALGLHFLHIAFVPRDGGFLEYIKGVALSSGHFGAASGFTWAAFAGSQARFLVAGFGWAALALAVVGLARRRLRLPVDTTLLLAGGLMYILLFRFHAHLHEFWALYLAPGLALLAVYALPDIPSAQGFPARRSAAVGLLLALALASPVGEGAWRLGAYRAGIDYDKPRQWALALADIFPPRETVVVMSGNRIPPHWGVEVHSGHLAVRANPLGGAKDLATLAHYLQDDALQGRRVVAVVAAVEAEAAGEDRFRAWRRHVEDPAGIGGRYLGLRHPGGRRAHPAFHCWDITGTLARFYR